MDPATLALIAQLAPIAFDIVNGVIKPKAAYTPEEEAAINAAYEASVAARRAAADELRAIEPDPE